MKAEYQQWITDNVTDAYGTCAEVTQKMQLAFPELFRVRGHYFCLVWGERAHWWLETEDGEIVDPTVSQFPSGGMGEYEQWIEGDQEPSGVCPNCSSYCYDGDTCCSEKCGLEYAAYCMNPLGR